MSLWRRPKAVPVAPSTDDAPRVFVWLDEMSASATRIRILFIGNALLPTQGSGLDEPDDDGWSELCQTVLEATGLESNPHTARVSIYPNYIALTVVWGEEEDIEVFEQRLVDVARQAVVALLPCLGWNDTPHIKVIRSYAAYYALNEFHGNPWLLGATRI